MCLMYNKKFFNMFVWECCLFIKNLEFFMEIFIYYLIDEMKFLVGSEVEYYILV